MTPEGGKPGGCGRMTSTNRQSTHNRSLIPSFPFANFRHSFMMSELRELAAPSSQRSEDRLHVQYQSIRVLHGGEVNRGHEPSYSAVTRAITGLQNMLEVRTTGFDGHRLR
jgi:hypothetical protein